MTSPLAIDEALGCGRPGLRTRPGTHLLGPTGDRLWADYLDDAPGFSGRLDFIHKINMPLLFTVTAHDAEAGAPPEPDRRVRWPEPARSIWYPSHLHTWKTSPGLRLTERRFITEDDTAVAVQHWENTGGRDLVLRLEVDGEWVTRPVAPDAMAIGRRRIPARGFVLNTRIDASVRDLWDGALLPAGHELEVVIAAAVGREGQDSDEELRRRIRTRLEHRDGDQAVNAQRASYQAWFDDVPRFDSSDPLLNRLWAYRWFLLRHNHARPGHGDLSGPAFYEGRSHKMAKTPWAPEGWEFSKLIPLSSPLHLLDIRWHHRADLGWGLWENLRRAQGDDGQFYARTSTETFHPYANFLGHAAYQHALIHGLPADIGSTLEVLKKQVLGERAHLTSGDELPIQYDHRLTGKEYQPSYWYFHGFPDDPLDPSTYTPLKRVDRAVYHYLNATGVSRLCAMTGDPDGPRFADLARRIGADILGRQWHSGRRFFYDLHHETNEPALVDNVVGFYPYWAGLTGAAHRGGLDRALSPEVFGSPWPVPSVGQNCAVYQPGGSWKGAFLKGRNGCMWDGPSWPYTNGIVLDAIGRTSRESGHEYDERFADLLHRYALLHFDRHDGRTPYLVEHYDSQTGEAISDEVDYHHSSLIDLMVRYVAGIEVGEEGVTIDPLDLGLDHFRIDDVRIAGHRMSVSYRAAHADRARADDRGRVASAGLTVTVDGASYHRPTLGRLTLGLEGLPVKRHPHSGSAKRST